MLEREKKNKKEEKKDKNDSSARGNALSVRAFWSAKAGFCVPSFTVPT